MNPHVVTWSVVSMLCFAVALFARRQQRRAKARVLEFFEDDALVRLNPGWIRSKYVADIFGPGVYHYLRELVADGLLECREEQASPRVLPNGAVWLDERGGRTLYFYRLKAVR